MGFKKIQKKCKNVNLFTFKMTAISQSQRHLRIPRQGAFNPSMSLPSFVGRTIIDLEKRAKMLFFIQNGHHFADS